MLLLIENDISTDTRQILILCAAIKTRKNLKKKVQNHHFLLFIQLKLIKKIIKVIFYIKRSVIPRLLIISVHM